MRILIAVVLILIISAFLFLQFKNTKFYNKNNITKEGDKIYGTKTFAYTTLLFMGVVVMMGYLFVLYAKAF